MMNTKTYNKSAKGKKTMKTKVANSNKMASKPLSKELKKKPKTCSTKK